MNVPIIILVWNGWEDTFECLQSLLKCDDVNEVWLVDNCSTEDRSEECKAIYPGLRCFRWDDNYGWAGGNNRALKVAIEEGYEYAYLLNNDCTVMPGFLARVLEAANSNKRLAAIGSCIAYSDMPEYVVFDGQGYGPGVKKLKSLSIKNIILSKEFYGTGVLIRLDATHKYGYFEEKLFCYAEEIEWSSRMRQNGYSIAVCQVSIIYHKLSRSDINANATYYRTRNLFYLIGRCATEKQKIAKKSAIYNSLVLINQARCKSDHEILMAVMAALNDGLNGHFGKRPDVDRKSSLRFRVLVEWWVLCARLRDKLRSIIGLKPGGYGFPFETL